MSITINKTSNILVIVESPNKTKHISEYLKKAGYNNVKVMASVGHIMRLNNGGPYYNSGIYPEEDFRMDLSVDDDKKEVVSKLKAQAKASDVIVLMTDGDREGECISWSLVKFLNLPANKYVRAITHEITPKAVVAAIENPIELDLNLVAAGLARMTIDKMLGWRMSPIAKTYVGAKSVGRCQSAGLKLIVDREKEIEAFKPEKYWDLYLNFTKNKTDFRAKYVGTTQKTVEHFKAEKDLKAIIKACEQNEYFIKDIARREKQEAPKPPFCTATFQQEAASKLNLSVKDAMSCAQKLFEDGKITYIRTDDVDISPEFLPILKAYVESAFGKKSYVAPRKGKKQEGSQEGHECLRVTDPELTPDRFNQLNQNNLLQKVYRIIWQRTIASALPNAVISETTYLINNNEQLFALSSNEIISEGYRTVYNYKDEEETDKDNAVVKETFNVDEKLLNTTLTDVAKETKPPARFKEATFLKELQKREIGRPSTYQSIVETVTSSTRGYCTMDSKTKIMTPTDVGIQLVNFLDRSYSDIINIEWTKGMEKGLDLIASGKKDQLEYLNEFYNTLENTVKTSSETAINMPAQTCPDCGAAMNVRRNKFGKLFYGCSTYPKCRGIVNIK